MKCPKCENGDLHESGVISDSTGMVGICDECLTGFEKSESGVIEESDIFAKSKKQLTEKEKETQQIWIKTLRLWES